MPDIFTHFTNALPVSLETLDVLLIPSDVPSEDRVSFTVSDTADAIPVLNVAN